MYVPSTIYSHYPVYEYFIYKQNPFEITWQFSDSELLFWTWIVLASPRIGKNK